MKKLIIISVLITTLFSCKKEENKTLVDKWKLVSAVSFITENKTGEDSLIIYPHPVNSETIIFDNTFVELDKINVGITIWEFTNNKLIKDNGISYPYHIINTDKTYIDVQTNPTKRILEGTVFYNDDLVLTTTKQYVTNMDGSKRTRYSVLRFDRQ